MVRDIPGELSNLPLLWDVHILPCLMYYLWYRVRHASPIPVFLDRRQVDRVSQAILEYEGNERRRNIDTIRERHQQAEKCDGDSSAHHTLLRTTGIGCVGKRRIFAFPGHLKMETRIFTQASLNPAERSEHRWSLI